MSLDENTLKELDSSMDENHREMVVMTMDHVRKFALSRSLAHGATQPPQLCSRTMSHMLDGVSSSIRTGYGSVVHPTVNTTWAVPGMLAGYDAKNIATMLRGIGGFATQVRVSVHNGREYLVLSGYPGLRNALKGTRYGIANAQVIEMGIGRYGIRDSAIKGFKLSCWVGAGIELGEWLYGDERLWSDLFGGVGVELVKAGVASAIGYLAAVAVGAAISTAALPIVAGAVIVFVAGITLNVLDNHFGIKATVKSSLRYAVDHMEQLHNTLTQIKTSDIQEYIKSATEDFAAGIAESLYDEAKNWVIRRLQHDGIGLPAWPSAPRLPTLPNIDFFRLQ